MIWLTTWPNLNNVVWFLMGDFLRLSPWSGGLGRRDVENTAFVIRVLLLFLRDWNIVLLHLYFSLIIVKSLQLRGRRQIAEPHKYYVVRVIVFLWHVFSLFLFFTSWEFRIKFPTVNNLHCWHTSDYKKNYKKKIQSAHSEFDQNSFQYSIFAFN